ncbi:MAG: prepilin-type N-terminal cleavage/methylation domain-containing protein [Fibrobacter sp.]|nr:prepilin-type N-terminal cleavage/methylation domain-containing protein [Fibrobacter sp.]
MQRGFTLIELLVALAAASVLSLSVLQFYGSYHKVSLYLAASYRQDASGLLHRVYGAVPYRGAVPNREGVPYHKFVPASSRFPVRDFIPYK